jgi:subtilisin-like proprotein convertase family protein
MGASLLAIATGAAVAQPTILEDLGSITTLSSLTRNLDLAAPGVRWYRMTIGAVPAGGSAYLDIGTKPGLATDADTMIGVYDASGNRKAFDDDDGQVFYSALSFGNSTNPRPADGSGAVFNGRDGALAEGVYYLAVSNYFTTFGATAWAVTSTATGVGDTSVFINFAPNDRPTSPTCALSSTPGTVRNDGTGAVTFSLIVTPGQLPTSTSHVVTIDTSLLGDPRPSPVTMTSSNGINFTYSMTIPTGLPAGGYPITASVQEIAPQQRSSTCTVNVQVINPPTGQCCTGDGCLLLTAADCAAQGGTYAGDYTTCGGCACLQGTIPNDTIENAIELSTGSVEQGSTCGASIDTGAPVCNFQTIAAPGVWYKVTGSGNSMLATLCGGPSYDSRMSVYCGSAGSLTCVGGNDDTCVLLSQVTFCTQEGSNYFILVHGYLAGSTGAFQISLTDDSTPCVPTVECIPTGACCLPDSCERLTAAQCATRGGSYNGDGTECITLGEYGASHTSTDPFPIAIPDYAGGIPGTASTSITVTGPGTVSDLAVSVSLTHTFAGDLIGTLDNGSVQVQLFNRDGGAANLSGEYVFTDLSANTWDAQATVISIPGGRYAPTLALNAFDGSPIAGTWTLTITDNAGADIGTIDNFSIGNVSVTNNCSGNCPTCAADYNQDGGVDGGDIQSFFTEWSAGVNCADVNLDGGVDGGDIQSFFLVWQTGGC